MQHQHIPEASAFVTTGGALFLFAVWGALILIVVGAVVGLVWLLF